MIGIGIVVVVVRLPPLRGCDSPTGSVGNLFPSAASIVVDHVAVGGPFANISVCDLVGLAGVAFSWAEVGVVFLQPEECVVPVVGASAIVVVAVLVALVVVFATEAVFAPEAVVVVGTC